MTLVGKMCGKDVKIECEDVDHAFLVYLVIRNYFDPVAHSPTEVLIFQWYEQKRLN
jgi:hypothetical protein